MKTLVVSRDSDLAALVEAAIDRSGSGPAEIEALSGLPTRGAAKPFDLAVIEHDPPATFAVALTARFSEAVLVDQAVVIVVAAPEQQDVRAAALEAGATDVVVRPFDPIELELRIGNALRRRAEARAQADTSLWIDRQVEKVRDELEARQEEIISRLSRAGEYRDQETGEHIIRMAKYCALIAEELGFPDETCRFLYLAAQMHDIGKVGIPDAILQKPGRLTPEERVVMETHTAIGQRILAGSPSPLIQAAELIAATHHERWDGTGYPNRLAGEDIPIAGRIAAVADVFDALTSERRYKAGWSLDAARDELLRCRGSHFDPLCVDAFLRRWDDIRTIAAIRADLAA